MFMPLLHSYKPREIERACYGLLVRWATPTGSTAEEVWLRFATGRPVSPVTTAFLAWCAAKLAERGITALLLVWDN